MTKSGKPKSPPKTKAPAPEPPQAITPPAPAAPPTPIDQKTIDIILAADLANIVKKVKAGKPLSNSEREILAQRRAKAPAAPEQPAAPVRENDYEIPTLVEQAMAALKDDNEVPRGRGRPKFKIDYPLVKRLATIQCTQEEIAVMLGCNAETLQRDAKFCAIYKKHIEHGKACLRRHQWRAVEVDRNPTMMIWLGKQYLGQKDRHEVTGKFEHDDKNTTDEKLRALPTSELRRLLGPGGGEIIDVTEVPTNGSTNGHKGTNGSNGHH